VRISSKIVEKFKEPKDFYIFYRLLLGIMMTTMFLSMWMNNTSTTAMMVPIVDAIMEELKKVI